MILSTEARTHRTIRIADVTWTVWDAGRVASGLGLAWFTATKRSGVGQAQGDGERLPGAEGGLPDQDEEDRRALLQPEQDLLNMEAGELTQLWSGGRSLTRTERRVTGPDGEIWLAQGTGPAWADERAAREILGVRLRCISHHYGTLHREGVTLAELSDDALREWIRAARQSSTTCSN